MGKPLAAGQFNEKWFAKGSRREAVSALSDPPQYAVSKA